MIAFHNPEDQFTSTVNDVSKAHAEFTNMKLMDALVKKLGEMPSPEEVFAHVICAVDQEGVKHFIWVEEKPVAGQTVDMSNVLCSIEPPKFGDLEN